MGQVGRSDPGGGTGSAVAALCAESKLPLGPDQCTDQCGLAPAI